MRRNAIFSAAALCSAILIHSALAQEEQPQVTEESVPVLEISETEVAQEITVTDNAATVSLPSSDTLLSEMKVYPAF